MQVSRGWLWRAAAAIALWTGGASAAVLPVCAGPDRAGRSSTCIYDGDTGWQEGVKWRLKDIDAPGLSSRVAACRAEQLSAIRARDQLRRWMAHGYTILPTGRSDGDGTALVDIELTDGRDVGRQLLSEDLVQASPHTGNRWCKPK